jgi:hypothetical protein
MSYIENDKPGEFFNDVSCTVPINPDNNCNCNNKDSNEIKENIERWAWLTDKWDTMTFKEKMSLFLPAVHYINTRASYKSEFDKVISDEIVEAAYKYCRNVIELKFDPDGQGIPNLIVVLDAIDLSAIPNGTIATKIYNWGVKYGFIENEYHPHDHHHHCCCEED